jgi:flagellar basal-body rod protein FlgG
MLQGLYSAASGMEAQQNQFNAISNDLANVNTTGYQQTELGFNDLLYDNGGSSTGTHTATGTGAQSDIIGRSDAQGAFQTTNRSLDVAISGNGYIEVRQPNGSIGLTRNGALQTDAEGHLLNQSGYPLVPDITIPKGVSVDDVKIATDGTVTAGKQTLGKIQLVDVPAPDRLADSGDSLYTVTTASGAAKPVSGSQLVQGHLEASNVDVNRAMGDLITAERSYQLSAQAVQYQDQMLQMANQLRHQ